LANNSRGAERQWAAEVDKTDRELGGTVAVIGETTTWSAQPAEYSEDSTTLYVNDSLSLLMTFNDLRQLIPSIAYIRISMFPANLKSK